MQNYGLNFGSLDENKFPEWFTVDTSSNLLSNTNSLNSPNLLLILTILLGLSSFVMITLYLCCFRHWPEDEPEEEKEPNRASQLPLISDPNSLQVPRESSPFAASKI